MSTAEQIDTRPALAVGAGAPAEPVAARRLVTPAVWSLVGFASAQVIRFGSNLVLTRFLLPEDYGVMALASAVVIGLTLFSDLGANLFLVQNKRAEESRYYNTAWTIGIARGLLLWLAAVALGWPMSVWYGAPVLVWLIPALGVSAVFAGLNSTASALLTRRLAPARVVKSEITAALVSAVLTVLWVTCVRADIWGFVVGSVASGLTMLVLSHRLLQGHRNRLCWDREAASELFRMSRWVLPTTIVTFFADQADRLLVGALCELRDVGLYQLATQLCLIPSQLLAALGGSLLFPLFSERLRAGAGADSSVRRARRVYLALGAVMALGLLLLGPLAVRLLFGARFRDAGWMTQALALGVVFRALGASGGQYFKALGRFRTLAITNALKVPAVLLLPPLGFVWFGLPGLLAGFVAADALRYAATACALRLEGVPGLRDDFLALSVVVATGAAVMVL